MNFVVDKISNSKDPLYKMITIHNLDNTPDSTVKIIAESRINYEPKVSLIIPVYNNEKYLRECLDSAVNQALKEIEIICINDGSSDNSLNILREYAQKDNRMTIIDQDNQGVSRSRNTAMNIARGEYFVFLDSDDYLRKDALKTIYNNMKKHELDMLSFGGVDFDDESKQEKISPYMEFNYLPKDFNYERFNYKSCYGFIHRMPGLCCLTAYRSNLIKGNHITFPDNLRFEDILFFLKSITSAGYCGIIKDKLYYRRLHPLSAIHNRNLYFMDYLKIADLCLQYIKNVDYNLYPRYREKYLRNSIKQYNGFGSKDRRKYKKILNKLLQKYNYSSNIINYPSLLQKLKQFFFVSQAKQVLSKLCSMRIDIKNMGQFDNSALVTAEKATISIPEWFSDDAGIGQIVSSDKLKQNIKIKAIRSGRLCIKFYGQRKRKEDDKYLPLWIDYKSIKIDGKELLSSVVSTWYRRPFTFEIPINDGQEVVLEVEQQYHQYSKSQLKEILIAFKILDDETWKKHKKLLNAVSSKLSEKSVFPRSQTD